MGGGAFRVVSQCVGGSEVGGGESVRWVVGGSEVGGGELVRCVVVS